MRDRRIYRAPGSRAGRYGSAPLTDQRRALEGALRGWKKSLTHDWRLSASSASATAVHADERGVVELTVWDASGFWRWKVAADGRLYAKGDRDRAEDALLHAESAVLAWQEQQGVSRHGQ